MTLPDQAQHFQDKLATGQAPSLQFLQCPATRPHRIGMNGRSSGTLDSLTTVGDSTQTHGQPWEEQQRLLFCLVGQLVFGPHSVALRLLLAGSVDHIYGMPSSNTDGPRAKQMIYPQCSGPFAFTFWFCTVKGWNEALIHARPNYKPTQPSKCCS